MMVYRIWTISVTFHGFYRRLLVAVARERGRQAPRLGADPLPPTTTRRRRAARSDECRYARVALLRTDASVTDPEGRLPMKGSVSDCGACDCRSWTKAAGRAAVELAPALFYEQDGRRVLAARVRMGSEV